MTSIKMATAEERRIQQQQSPMPTRTSLLRQQKQEAEKMKAEKANATNSKSAKKATGSTPTKSINTSREIRSPTTPITSPQKRPLSATTKSSPSPSKSTNTPTSPSPKRMSFSTSTRSARRPAPNIVIRDPEAEAAAARAAELAALEFPSFFAPPPVHQSFEKDEMDREEKEQKDLSPSSQPQPPSTGSSIDTEMMQFHQRSPGRDGNHDQATESTQPSSATDHRISDSNDSTPNRENFHHDPENLSRPTSFDQSPSSDSNLTSPQPEQPLSPHYKNPLLQLEEDFARQRLQTLLTEMNQSSTPGSPFTALSPTFSPAFMNAFPPPLVASNSPRPSRVRRPSLPSTDPRDTYLFAPSPEIQAKFPYHSCISLTRTGSHPGIPRQYRRVNQDRILMKKYLMATSAASTLNSPTGATNARFFHSASPASSASPSSPLSPSSSPPIPGHRKDEVLFGILDGHGALGNEVAEFVAKSVPRIFADEIGSLRLDLKPIDSIQYCIERLQEKLVDESGIDLTHSGCSILLATFTGGQLYVSNTGNCRAILGTRSKSKVARATHRSTAPRTLESIPGSPKVTNFPDPIDSLLSQPLRAVQLSTDHLPSISNSNIHPDSARILHAGGRIDRCRDSHGEVCGPVRIFAPMMDSNQIQSDRQQTAQVLIEPVSCLTRCLGSTRAHSYGVISEPTIQTHTVNPLEDEFLVLASDGLWSVLSNDEVIQIVATAENPVAGIKSLVQTATLKWQEEEDVVDDISCTIVYFKQPQRQVE